MFLFGGSGPGARCFNDLQILDPDTSSWLECMTATDVNGSGSGKDGRSPSPEETRSGDGELLTTAIGVGYGSVVMASRAGAGNKPLEMCDVHDGNGACADANTSDGGGKLMFKKREVIMVDGEVPGRRAGQTATAVGQKLVVFGGSCG